VRGGENSKAEEEEREKDRQGRRTAVLRLKKRALVTGSMA
jgi:hypothetical protein